MLFYPVIDWFALLLCVATAVGKPAKPQDIPNVFKKPEFATKDEASFNKINTETSINDHLQRATTRYKMAKNSGSDWNMTLM